jgi:hypothetical protein
MIIPMICTCDIDGFKETEDRRLRIFKKMPIYGMHSLATSIIMSLAFDFQCEASIYSDQWFGVTIKSPLLEDPLWIECDHPFDAFAFAWEYFADKFPGKISWHSYETTDKYIESISEAMFATYKVSENNLNNHYKTHDDCKYNCGCDICNSLSHILCYQKQHIEESWGAKVFDTEINNRYSQA